MKRFLLLSLIFFCALGHAQRFSFDTNYKSDTVGSQYLPYMNIILSNDTTDTLYLAYKTIYNDVNPAWEATLCDNINCYTTIPDSSDMNPVPGGSLAGFSLGLALNNTPDTCSVSLLVYEKADPNVNDTITFQVFVWLDTTTPSGIQYSVKQDLKVYPNPSNGIIQLNNSSTGKLQIIDIAGRVVYNKIIFASEVVNISGFSKGNYTLFFKNEYGVRESVIVIKQ